MILDAFLHSLNCVAILVILGSAGYITAHLGWYDEKSSGLIARLVTFLSLPAYLFSSVMGNLTHDELLGLLPQVVLPFAVISTGFIISLAVVKFGRVNSIHRGIFSSAFTCSNNMFIGVPVSLSLFGEAALIPTLFYFFANTTFFWTIGNFLEARDGALAQHEPLKPLFSWESLRRVFSPPFCGFLIAMLFVTLDFRPPEFIMTAARYMGGITSPLALIFIGLMLYRIGIRNIRFTSDLIWVFAGRFLIMPATCLLLSFVFPVSADFAKVFVIQAALPCITQIAVLAKFHHADAQFATTCVASTTLGCLVALPVWMIILTQV